MSYGDADDPLTQAMVDTSEYKGKSCGFVLEEILKPYRARIYQQLGGWHITQVDLPGKAITQPILYPSDAKTEVFRKQCEYELEGEVIIKPGSSVEFTMERGEFLHPESVVEANKLRDAVFAQKGQEYANLLGTCPTEPDVEVGKLYLVNATVYEVRVDNNVDFSFTIPASNVPTLVENLSGPLQLNTFRVRKPAAVSFTTSERIQVQVMRANDGGTVAGAIPGPDGTGVSSLSVIKTLYESTTLEDAINPFAPNFNNYEDGQDYVILLQPMPAIEPLHYKLELLVNGELATDANRLSRFGSVTARISRLENRNIPCVFGLTLSPIGGMAGLQTGEGLYQEVPYGDVDYVDFTFTTVYWDSASFNPGFSVVLSEVSEEELVIIDSSSKGVWIEL
jgi:hypothetical protein